MNIIEAEDLVKGLPDQALFQEAQYPSGRIPQFLAVSEVQRRQDMRQRFQATQQGQQATVKDQILQGGIGSTGMAPEMSSAPPMAPQMPPQGAPMPPQMPPPMGMAMGGIVPYRMQEGGTVRDLTMRMKAQNAAASGPRIPLDMDLKSFVRRMLPTLDSLPPAAQAEVLMRFEPQYNTARANTQMFNRASVEDPSVILNELSGSTAPVRPQPVAAPVAAPTAAPVVASQRNASSNNVSPGLPAAGAEMNAPRQQAGAGTPSLGGMGLESLMRNLMKTQGLSPEEQAYINLNKQIAEQGLPPPIDLSQYVQAAQQRQQSAREEARQDAIASTLMNLGTGLFAGDPAAGMQRATQEAMATLREGRKEASAEGRAAEQLQLQAAQQNRQNIIDNMKFRTESVGAVANIMSGNRKADRETQMQAAQIVSNIQINLQRMQNDLTVAGMGRNDANRKVQSEARNRATELVLKSAEGKFPPPSAQDMATQVDTITSQFLGGMDSSARATNRTLNPPPESAINFLKKNPNLRAEFESKYGAGSARQYLGD
jgi:hypothetical protein